MDKKEEEFLARIKATFRVEAEEHLRSFSLGLIELEKAQPKEKLAEIIETLFREIHSLKGAARSVDHKDAESVCQPLESVFSALKRKEITLSPSFFVVFYQTADWLTKLILAEGEGPTTSDRLIIRELIQQLKELATGKIKEDVEISERKERTDRTDNSTEINTVESAVIPLEEHNPLTGTSLLSNESVRIRISKLDPLLLQAEEIMQTKNAIKHRLFELQEINDEITEWIRESNRWKGNRSDLSSDLSNEWIDGNDIRLTKLERRITSLTNFTKRDQYSLNQLVDHHLDSMKQILMLPVSTLVEIFPGMVREISRDQKKEIDFIIRGSDLEIDKRILEELKDPLIHLIRNSIHHGIGKSQERIFYNKPPRGKIILAFYAKENGQVEITLSDDGNGIDTDKLLKTAIKAGIFSDETASNLEYDEVLNLIYYSGVSTSSIITDISGHGLGLSIVKEKILKLNGKISVETEKNKGTTFRILLPMTLATFRGIVVKVKESVFIIPTTNVERVIQVAPEEINTVENHETIRIGDRITSVADLGRVLGLAENMNSGRELDPEQGYSNHIRLVVLNSDEHRIAFKVDEIIDEQQVLVKGLGKLLRRVKNISGATILGTGKVVPVLNIADLIRSAVHFKGKNYETSHEKMSITKRGKILVVEDSITSRTMLKNVLEFAGYKVVTAVDGLDGFTKAREGEFDIVLSDVDMPRVNGFELVTKIRGDKKLHELPVILLTALGSQEDREHGIDVGADAYIVKSSFDQGNLLEIVKKLI